jgi:hypothetical protein
MLKKTTVKSKVCLGMVNKTKRLFYLPFFDYDYIDDYNKIKTELLGLQQKYRLSDIFIFTSENGYNAFSLDKLHYETFKKLCYDSKYLCDDYRRLGLKRGFLVLRIGKDKILKEVLFNKGKYKKSLPHLIALNNFYGVETKYNMSEFDKNLDLRIYAYRSEKHGFLKVKEL